MLLNIGLGVLTLTTASLARVAARLHPLVYVRNAPTLGGAKRHDLNLFASGGSEP